jgi:hypothetical protein
MYDLSAIEADLLTRLDTVRSTYNLSLGTLTQEELKHPLKQAQVLVSYRRTEFSSPQSLNQFQYASLRFELITRFKDLRSHAQAYPVLAALRDRLWNYVPAGVNSLDVVEPLQPIEERFMDRKLLSDGIWSYSQIFVLKLVCHES